MEVVSAINTPPHKESIIANFQSYFLKIAIFVLSNTPYTTNPNKNASITVLPWSRIK